ncbi:MULTISPECIES: MarR family winged helix-turn-helix transcriptional regulator [unclassified Pseudonocardia]|uniref:MarR family winged helix-turn-helix transcriptional regulator n=1 Tax=unclassified Pseudonocardia TaxID=2619320 RepID=UPI0015BF0CB0|nr:MULTISPECIES: MarR family winged helix-turn-helix transcriptional regulator [unclassified Pseudonocardia]NWJ74010.1 winged helix-turn-helix transcriptional regulator [Pseudonocardia pini]
MDASSLPADRPAVGQLLVRTLQHFRAEVFAVAAERGFGDIREAHLQIFGNLGGVDGVRLTTLAARAHLSLAATAELVDDLQRRGYLERVRDPDDGRARLIRPTARGRVALEVAGGRVAEIEGRWSALLDDGEFTGACDVLARLLARLDGASSPDDQGRSCT